LIYGGIVTANLPSPTPTYIIMTGTGALPVLRLPIYPNSIGLVDLVALERSGTVSGSIHLTTQGFAPGAYTISAVTESSSDTVVLGSMMVTTGSIPVYVSGSGSTPVEYFPAPWLSTGSARFGGAVNSFPAGFSPFDVAMVSMSDSNGNIVATATVTPVPRGYLTELSPVQPGALAGAAAGYALVHVDRPILFIWDPIPVIYAATTFSTDAAVTMDQGAGGTLSLGSGGTLVVNGNLNASSGGTVTVGGNSYTGTTTLGSGTLTLSPVNTLSGGTLTLGGATETPIFSGTLNFAPYGRLAIHASGLPPHTVVTYALDGTDIGTAMTDTAGKLNIFATQGGDGKIPISIDLFNMSTLTVHDGSGNVYLSAGF
jgi:hypothetical protein